MIERISPPTTPHPLTHCQQKHREPHACIAPRPRTKEGSSLAAYQRLCLWAPIGQCHTAAKTAIHNPHGLPAHNTTLHITLMHTVCKQCCNACACLLVCLPGMSLMQTCYHCSVMLNGCSTHTLVCTQTLQTDQPQAPASHIHASVAREPKSHHHASTYTCRVPCPTTQVPCCCCKFILL